MIKKLDKLIIKSFLGPFIATFFIALFILIMQTLWKYIDDLVGKGLDFITIGKFIWYMSATLLTLAMPIAILLSSIMTFGKLGESFELVAIKSSGISLLRFMRPLLFISIILCGITFVFANYIIPVAFLRSSTLYFDIKYKKPALDLKEGVFFTYIPNYAIKVGKKEADGKTIHQVIIYEQNNILQDNCIVAEKGVMQVSPDKKFMEFMLQNGYRYQENGNNFDTSNEFIRLRFTEYKKLFDLSALKMTNTSDSSYQKNYKMLSVAQLTHSMDSIYKLNDSLDQKIEKDMSLFLHYYKIPDSTWKKVGPVSGKSFLELVPDSLHAFLFERAINIAGTIKGNFQFAGTEIENHRKDLRYHQIEWHRKFALSLACLVLFFIGAPLGSIIRKGGLGLPLVVAIFFFLLFHLLNMFGEKFVKEDVTSVVLGMWLSVIVLIPLGIFLTYKAMRDSQLFNKELYVKVFRKLRPILSIFNRRKSTGSV